MDKDFKYDLKNEKAASKKEEIAIIKDEKSSAAYKGGRKLISNSDKDILAHSSTRIVTTVFTIGAVALLIYCIVAGLGFFIILPALMLLVFVPLTVLSFISYVAAKKNEKKEDSYFSNLQADMREHIIKIEQSIKKRERVKLAITISLAFTIFAAPIIGTISIVTSLTANPGKIPIFGIGCVAYFVISIVSVLIYSAVSGSRRAKIEPKNLKVEKGAVYSCIVLSETNSSQKFRVLVGVIGVDRFLEAVSENRRYEKGEYVKVEYDAANLGACKIVG